MDKHSKIVIIGAGVFGLSTALELSQRGFKNIVVLDRHVPPVADGSSVDISRIIRFDYGDQTYTEIAKEAYDMWSTSPIYSGVFFRSPFVLATSNDAGRSYINNCISSLNRLSLPWKPLPSVREAKEQFPILTLKEGFYGYRNDQAGWADAAKAIAVLRDRCIEAGVSFISGAHGTVNRLLKNSVSGKVYGAETKSGDIVHGDVFILATGAWTSQLVPMYNSTLATGQVLGFLKLSDSEMEKFKHLPICINFDSGWFCFPPHEETGYLKVAVHGWGYTRSTNEDASGTVSSPPTSPRTQRANFAPVDGIQRLRAGVAEVLPDLANRPFDRTAVCWYTDTPTGDFIMDYHPDHKNVFMATGGSGHAFKFLPVLGKYVADAMERTLPAPLQAKWRFRLDYRNESETFKGDGSRGGPSRRELTVQEKSML